jgi:membrane-associated phospholipid phosphatase
VKIFVVGMAVALLGGCVGSGNWGEGPRWPSSGTFTQAASKAATDPQTWLPLATATLLIVADVDDKWSQDLADDQPLFGDDAEDVSDDLRDVASGAYLLTALLAPSPTIGAKARGLAVGAGTAMVDGVLSRGLKDVINRERPDGSNDRSMPSGHASKASSRTAMALRNLRDINMPDWSRHVANWSLHGVAVGAGLARVEARKHHLSDVFVGYAIGNFVASFMYEAFLDGHSSQALISFQPVADGGALTLTLPLR